MENSTFNSLTLQLEGLMVTRSSRLPLFFFFFFSFLFVMVTNAGMILLILVDRNLHQPMFLLFCNLAFNDILGNCLVLPRVMSDILRPPAERLIGYHQCVVQAFLVHTFGTSTQTVLMIMAFDRYVAICNPLRYSVIMTNRMVVKLTVSAWGSALVLVGILLGLTVRLSRCRTLITNPYCDNASLFKLSCESVVINNIYGLTFTVVLSVVSVGSMVITYAKITAVCLSRRCKSLNSKALRTCSTHLIVYLIMFTSGKVSIALHRFPQYVEERKLAIILYHIIPCSLNPIIYGVQSNEVKKVLTGCFRLQQRSRTRTSAKEQNQNQRKGAEPEPAQRSRTRTSAAALLKPSQFCSPVPAGRRERMVADIMNSAGSAGRRWSPFRSIKVFVLCHSLLQLAQLLVSGYMKSSISTIERRYGLSSQKSGILAAFNEVGNTVLIVFVSFFGSRVHRPRYIGGGALLACLASLLMAVPHFLSGHYIYTDMITTSTNNKSGLCFSSLPSNQTCHKKDSDTQWAVYPLLLLGQLLLGIGAVPIQPFGISYIDDYASRRNSPLYLGILLAMTSIGPALGFVTGSFLLRFYVDFDKLPRGEIELEQKDLRWVGAWWLGFLVASSFLFLTALPYLFFPREMPKENAEGDQESRTDIEPPPMTDPVRDLTLLQFLKSFPRIALRTLSGPIYLLVVLALVNMAALVSGLATFMPKFIEKQFSQTIPLSNMMIGGIGMPLAVLGVVLGGALMRRFNMSVRGASKLCTAAILLCLISALPMIFIGCSTQKVAEVYPDRNSSPKCSAGCGCPPDAFNPICGSNGEEYRSPCHAGCLNKVMDADNKPTNFTNCRCIYDGSGSAQPGTCGSGCSHLLLPFIILMGITSFIISFTQTPSYMMVLRTVPPEDKSFAVGVQYMLFRVLAFLPGPVLYGSIIDTTCILWGEKCGQRTSCLYYNLDGFRKRFLGLMVVFVCGALLCFLLTMVALRRRAGAFQLPLRTNGRYEMVGEQKAPEKEQTAPEKEQTPMKT